MMPIQTTLRPYMTSQAITTQPGAYAGQTQPGAFPGQMLLQMIEVLELVTGFETENKYVLRNATVYYAFEESEFCERQCCGAGRSFTMHIVDNFKRVG
ncbi:hypothetical protein ANCDUO_07210 [Ancylostoma duodenale]|uniref:Phospholipid scramblase n=1 Tax=Ancylostoma duodenale TaxID=51022 RepID=A0A0C2GZE8_9BILA|nr:hypothetical protein ANCDUO_07210 [Ancylostoma duodenale]